jgi:hypothetical protein
VSLRPALRFLAPAALLAILAAGCPSHPLPPAAPAALRLTDVTEASGLTYRYSTGGAPPLNIVQLMGAGAGFLDYDNDGWLDVVCVGLPHPALYHNDHGHFTDVTPRSGLAGPEARWYGCATGDYDNDGFTDLFLTAYNETALFHNNGNGTFTNVTQKAGVALHRWASSAAFADVNHDGLLDLYVACYVRWAPSMPQFVTTGGVRLSLGPDAYDPQHGVLFLNDGGGRFHDATDAAGLAGSHGKGLGVAFADPDEDGDDDLVVANDQEPLDYFENDGHGHFHNVAAENGTAFSSEGKRQGGMGLDWGDYDGDGREDLFVANFADEPKSLYHNLGHATFANDGYPAGISQTTRPWVAFGTRFADLDLDGLLDLTIVNGHVQDAVQQVDPGNSYLQKPQLFRNVGGGRFAEISAAAGPDFQRPIAGRALAIGDFDNDGDLDLLIADLNGSVHLFRNDGGPSPGHWLMLQLTAGKGNHTVVGARIEIQAAGRTQVREFRTDGSYLSAQDPRVHFGLANAEKVDEIRIRWPSGSHQTLRDVPANRVLQVREQASPTFSGH